MKKPRKRITKQELKQDEFVTFTTNVITFTMENKTYVLYGLGILAIIFLGIITGVFISNHYNTKAVDLFSSGMLEYHSNDQTEQNTPPSSDAIKRAAQLFNDAFREYPRSSVAPQAAYYYGLTQLSQHDMDEAKRTFEYFLEKWPENSLAPEVTVLLGISYIGNNNYKKAIEYFEKVETTFNSSPNVSYALLQKGICYMKLENMSAARETFQRIIDEYSTSPWTADAKDYLLLVPEQKEMTDNPESDQTPEETSEKIEETDLSLEKSAVDSLISESKNGDE